MSTSKDLSQKLGTKLGLVAYSLYVPNGYDSLLPYPIAVTDINQLPDRSDWVQSFYIDKLRLDSDIELLKTKLMTSGQLWLCWPKKSSGVDTNLSDNIVRTIGLNSGLVDVKVVAIDDTWSGLICL